jgi:hypothetical protein
VNFVSEIVYIGYEDRIATWQGGLKAHTHDHIKMLGKVRTRFNVTEKRIVFNIKDLIKLYVEYPKLSKAWEKFLIEYYNKLPWSFDWEKID